MATADQILTNEQQGKPDPKSLWQQFLDKRNEWAAQQPSLGAQLQAMAREAAKDINDKLHQVFFGQSAGIGEPGTPLVPTQAMVTKDLGTVHGYNTMLDDAAARGGNVHQQEKVQER